MRSQQASGIGNVKSPLSELRANGIIQFSKEGGKNEIPGYSEAALRMDL